jgi:hypothetical protein
MLSDTINKNLCLEPVFESRSRKATIVPPPKKRKKYENDEILGRHKLFPQKKEN